MATPSQEGPIVASRKSFCMDGGWVKLYRKLSDNPHMRKPAYRSVWIEILLSANHNVASVIFRGERINLKPGQFTTGAYKISEATGVPRGTVERILKLFKSEEQIEMESDRQCSLITVLNWDQYQHREERNEERVRNDRGTSEERVRTKQEFKNGRMKEWKNNTITTSDDVGDRSPEQIAEADDIKFVIELFQMKLNPTINYGNRTNRAAALYLVRFMGREKLANTVQFILDNRSDNFCPVITTPYQLKEKFAQLMAYYQKQNNQQPNVATV